jgi:uncharacterized integral membrane protein (TIGR00698 family)
MHATATFPISSRTVPRGGRVSPVLGLLLSGALAAGGMWLGGMAWARDHGLSALTLAIVLGMLAGNTLLAASPRLAAASGAGVQISKQTLLRAGIVLYGLRLTVQDIAQVGLAGVVIDAAMLASTFALASFVGTRWLGLDRKTSMLIGAGHAICGAAAVLAAEPVVKARAEQVTVAVATVVLFGTVGIFLYPVLYTWNAHLHIVSGSTTAFGVYAGSTIQEVAQVVAAARSVGSDAADAAVIAKMVRVMMLAPFLLLLSGWLARAGRRGLDRAAAGSAEHEGPSEDPTAARGRGTKVAVPWFAFGFVAVVLFNSLHLLPARAVGIGMDIDTILLAMAMAALGLSTQVGALRRAGARPMLLAAGLSGWLVIGGALVNRWVPALLA